MNAVCVLLVVNECWLCVTGGLSMQVVCYRQSVNTGCLTGGLVMQALWYSWFVNAGCALLVVYECRLCVTGGI